MHLRTNRHLFPLLLGSLLAACGYGSGGAAAGSTNGPADAGADVGGSDAGADVGVDTGPALPSCADNFDCRGGEVCRAGFCREACAGDDPCTGPLPTCDEERGYCVGCLVDDDCPANSVCGGDTCVFFCEGDDACASGERCNLGTGACAVPDCEGDADCPGGFNCDGFACVPIDDVVCTPEEATCQGNTLVVCSRDGTSETRTPCDAGDRCVSDADGAECREVICAPSERGCLDNDTRYLCDSTGTTRTTADCEAGEVCLDGSCTSTVCTPNATRCSGDSLATCNALGTSESLVACDDTADCSGADFGCRCVSGECLERRCAPGSARCVGAGIQRCLDDGSAWDTVETCPGAQSCSAGACR